MTTPIRLAATWMLVAVATCAAPAFAQNSAATAAIPGNAYGAEAPVPFGQTEKNRNREQQLLGAPREYSDGDGGTQRNIDHAQRDEQRMTVTGGQPASGKGQRKAPAGAHDPLRGAAQPGRPNAGADLLPAGAAKNAYADPYGAGKRSVYRSPW
ncbi:hypothetical protein [Paraburkholderia sp. GAS348]|uniref:hypothetical protein n=1 Tax=Paraburkholderia sp. GAS348 TaxID=3035132 RepID=UPI003D1A6719